MVGLSSWTVAPGAAPQAALFTEDIAGAGYALIMVVPPEPNAAEKVAMQRVPRETILIVDTSGSMEGVSMAQAKAAVMHALSTLTERDLSEPEAVATVAPGSSRLIRSCGPMKVTTGRRGRASW